MTTRTGTISVDTSDIFPIIKKWLYSEHDIFLRELISNSSDAITKRANMGRTRNIETPSGMIKVVVDKGQGTIKIVDNGIGMTEEEIEKYIAQLAFSGAEEFVKKLKKEGADGGNAKEEIIGKFGLGFYSSFMVANKVQVDSLSMNEGAKAARWICEGTTDYSFEENSDQKEVGTTVTLYINDENKEFLNSYKTRETLKNYCDFMPYPIELLDIEERNKIVEENAKAEKEEDKKPLPNDIINDTRPLWKRDPSELEDEDYKKFYRQLFPMDQEPLFWLHLNVDHPFELKGILFFPKLNPMKPVNENNIRLYSRQVFVSDNVKSVVPEFLGLLKGAIDSTDIPLNVSRSSLQGDPNVKKISNYIIKKVAESLKKLFLNDRERYETIWEDIALFVKYGIVSDTKFDELMRKYSLFKNSDNKLLTLDEYKEAIPESYKEKMENKVIYFEQNKSDDALRSQLQEQSIPVISTDDYIDPHFMQHAETQKQDDKELRFVSIDSEFENLLQEESTSEGDIKVKEMFEEFLGLKDKKEEERNELDVQLRKLKTQNAPAYFKVDEQMKRFQQMTKNMGNTALNMPLKKTLVVNPANPLIQNAVKIWEKGSNKKLAEMICHHVQDLATISGEGLKSEDKQKFVNRSQDLIEELSTLAL